MNGIFEYYLRLTRFRNIDLPLQGLYFVQIRFLKDGESDFPVQIIPYSASTRGIDDTTHTRTHALFPSQISPDDSLQSSGFLIRYSEESVSLYDSFRISWKDAMYFSKDQKLPSLHGSVRAFERPIMLQLDLLFTTADEIGGVGSLIRENVDVFPTEYMVVASQKYIIQPPGSAVEFFRIPLGLIRESITMEECSDSFHGDIYPCAFVEGVICSALVQIQFPSSIGTGVTEFVQRMSFEWGMHPLEVEDCILRMIKTNLESISEICRELELQIPEALQSSHESEQPQYGCEPPQIIQEINHLLSECVYRWNTQIVANFPSRPRTDRSRFSWRERLVNKARTYFQTDEVVSPVLTQDAGLDQLLFPVKRTSIPHLRMKIFNPSSTSPQVTPGAHLIVLVHGYQGSMHDVRVIRNQVACLCPNALIFSSCVNEEHTDGHIDEMGIRLANEVRTFVEAHSTSFYIIGRISFLAHSLGGLIVRAALPHMEVYKNKLNFFMTLSTPHVGITNKFIESGVMILNLFKKSQVLEQLTLMDSYRIEDCELYRLASMAQLRWFKRILLVGSSQDRYAPVYTSILSSDDSESIQMQLQAKVLESLTRTMYHTIDVSFDIQASPTLDTVLGRAAHIKFLESPVLIQLLFLSIIELIDIA